AALRESVKIPFSIYAFFGYLLAGFVVLVAVDFSYDQSRILTGNSPPLVITFWTVAAYVLGHLIAGISSTLLEYGLTRRTLGSSEDILLTAKRQHRGAWLFPTYFRPLPAETRDRVLSRAQKVAGFDAPGRGLFLH